MPTLQELSIKLLDQKKGIKEIVSNRRFQSFLDGLKDIELLLTYLHQDYAWKKDTEIHSDVSLFHTIGERLAEEISNNEAGSLAVKEVPDWLDQFVYYLFKTGETIITFNYDTLIERVAWHSTEKPKFRSARKSLEEQNLFSPLIKDIRSIFGPIRDERYGGQPSFSLIKLHGSINWYYTRTQNFESQQIYFVPVRGKNPKDDLCKPLDEFTQDMQRLIIPPVADKSPFYSHEFVRSLWTTAAKALQGAEEIYFLGYSLPVTDLAVKLLLRSSVENAKIFVFSKGKDRTKFESRYHEVLSHLPKSKFRFEYGKTAIARLAASLFEEVKDKPDRNPPIWSWPNMNY